jgi:hypothetical protein
MSGANEGLAPYTCKHQCERSQLKEMIFTQAEEAAKAARYYADSLEAGRKERLAIQSTIARLEADLAQAREALGRHNLHAANGDEITVADELMQAAGTLEAFVEANKDHPLLDCCDNDGVEYQSEYMSGLMDHAHINARTLRKWATALREAIRALKEPPHA